MNYKDEELDLNISNQILQNELKNTASDSMTYESFFSQLKLIFVSNDNAYILVPTYIIDYIKTTFYETIQRALINALEKKVSLTFISDIDEIKELVNKEKTTKFIKNETQNKSNNNVKNNLTFENYAIGNFNKMALKAAKEISKEYKDNYNPLFIYSSSGLGKTHLLHAIGNEFVKKNKTCLYVNPDILTRRLVEQLRLKNQEQINKIVDELTSYDCLMFDDVQQYGNKESTLNVLFNVINIMKSNHKQIIFCADKSPNQLGGFEQRFLTRFEGGLTIEINNLELEDVISVLKFKLKENHINVDLWEDAALRYIARNFSTSIRSIEGAISRIKLFSDGDDFFTYDLHTMQNIFKNVTKSKESITPERIIETVCKYYGVDRKKIISSSRVKEIVIPRKIIIYFLKNNFDFTLKEIGKMVGDQTHSTVIASLKWIEANIQSNSSLKNAIEKIQNMLKKII
ncbi:chromosomal replication initiator protein DnaA [Metamycoplasma alkalescens]|uniref:Chromosomal replication initiator protein DnaA n=3 Tax=Metamycoplasma alkalescens TaxID=45363 RepID=N9U0A1_9BACT|nr:chromosomal replication initiator protein DnaA [Metamycoplasma alkalescens]ENY53987.1 Chromosomal replication initiator protein [Metamycoplasma alkalescens 14918]PYF42652.1 chromosomal replication initiator protein [Metamycoplasma alkalescens]